MKKRRRKTTSGTLWSDADYAAAGYGRVGLRLRSETLARLDEIAKAWGVSRSRAIELLVKRCRAKTNEKE